MIAAVGIVSVIFLLPVLPVVVQFLPLIVAGGAAMTLETLVTVCAVITVMILASLAFAFWSNPARGLAQTTHRIEQLPLVLADRYTAFALLAVAILVLGDLPLMAAFFAVCAFMGFADGLIYARAGHPHMKHTISGVLSVIALGVTLAALIVGKDI